jgi:beta-lactamase regulating signal transducer with metallopeptidase domain
MNVLSSITHEWLDWAIAASWQLALLVGLLAALTYLLRNASAQLRYGLWLLVLIKALLPPTLGVSWGIGSWGIGPIVNSWPQESNGTTTQMEMKRLANENNVPEGINEVAVDLEFLSPSPISLTVIFWAVGCLGLSLAVAWRYLQIVRASREMRLLEEGSARVELERLASRFSIRQVPELYTTDQKISPMLAGAVFPKIILPQPILDQLNPQELRMVLAHELVHWRRRDTWIGWLQVLVQCVYWFHPLVWWANARIRHERECACDETVLRELQCDRDRYGETIVQVLTTARGKSLVVANMVGVFERGSLLQTRLEEIMCFDPNKRRFGWLSRFVLIAAALVLLPMASPGVEAESTAKSTSADRSGAKQPSAVEAQKTAPSLPKTNWPTIVSTTPKIGDTSVEPKLTEISVTFDRDMDVTGYSWTGGGEFYPETPKDRKPVWTDRRTCVLPVQLKKGAFYRIGINSSSFQNFRSKLGVSAPTSAIYFSTTGAKRSVISRVRVPKIVKIVPSNGATDIDPATKRLMVKFDIPMDTAGHSWTRGGLTFPNIPEGGKTRWSSDGKTCFLPVTLRPGMRYELGLNSVSHKNFASKWGVPLEPVSYEFKTAGDSVAPPRIVKMIPKNGATNVSPTLKEIQVVFDKPMAAGFSWTGGGDHFPAIPEGAKPSWSKNRKTCTLPVKLKPNWEYRLGLNSKSFKNFASSDGLSLEPVVYKFQTSSAKE